MKIKLVAVLMSMALFAACSGEAPNPELAAQNRPIINGLPVDEPMHDAVVSLHDREGSSWYVNIFCSGTLISDTVVLTAAHCVNVGRRKPVTMSPDALVIYVGDNPTTDPNPEVHVVTEILMHPGYNSSQLTNDIALVRLASPASATPVPALPASLGFNAADVGGTLNFAGFGQDELGNYDQKLQLDGTLGSIYSDTQIYYTQNAGGPCFGDSGGPAFIKRGNKAYVGGMTSYGDSYCTQYGVSTRADAFEAMINDFIGIVPDPFCGDGTCDANEACDVCIADCGACPVDPFCGDGNCDPNEACDECIDCGACPVDPFCGDGNCDANEACDVCIADCGACPTGPECGNGVCEAGEDCDSCGSDCPAVYHPKKGRLACCGNGVCESREDATKCAIDCQ